MSKDDGLPTESEIRLVCGELTAGEMRTVKAALKWYIATHSEHVSSGNRALTLVNAQAKDGGLWFTANLAPEAYLQEALRKLHAAVEKDAAARPEASGELEETVAIPVKMLDELNDYADQVMRAKSLRSYTRATIGKFMRKLAALRASGGKAGK